MATTIKLKNGSGAPLAGDLVQGEPAFDLTNKRLYTEDSGGSVIEVGTNPGTDVTFADNRKAIFGAGSDLEIYHTATDSVIADVGTGNLKILANDLRINNADSSKSYITGFNGAQVYLYHNGSPKLETTSTGIDVTGTATMDGLTVDGNDSYTSNIRFTYGSSAPTYFADWGYKSNSDGNKVFLTITDGGSAKDVLVANYNGNVGIGTTSPVFPLDVMANSGANSLALRTRGSDDYSFLSFRSNDGTEDLGGPAIYRSAASTSNLLFYTANGGAAAERMRIGSTGSVGIGTSSPSHNLDVTSSTASTDVSMRVGPTSSSGDNDGTLIINNGGSGDAMLRFDYEVYADRARIGVTGSGQHLGFYTAGANERMRIDSSGNVGIGTTSPGHKLEVNASAFDGIQLQSAGTDCGYLGVNTGTVYVGAGSTLAFHTGNNSLTNGTERMRIDASGNVGIGTTSPSEKLNVSGNVRVTSGFVSFSGSISTPSEAAAVYRPADNTLAFSTANTERMRIDSSGNVILNQSAGSSDNTLFRITGGTAGYSTLNLGDTDDGNIGNIQYNHSTNSLAFDVNNTERMRIDSSGNVLVGKSVTSLSTVGAVVTSSGTSTQTANFSGTNQVHIYNQLDTSGTSQVDFRVAGFSKGRIEWTNTATSYLTGSDVRLKENIVDAPAGNIDDIRVRSFDWKADGSHQTYGMVAQELVDVAPEAVSQGETEEDMWGVDYSKLVPMMIKEIQDLKAEVAALKGE